MKKIVIGIGLLVLLAGGAYAAFGRGGEPSASQQPTAQTAPMLVNTEVVAEGRVVPVRSVELRFANAGMVAEVLVAEGDRVASGAPLARLDTRALALGVEQARAALAGANATYQKLLAGATPEEVAAAQAQIEQAQAQLRQATGSVTSKDIAAAQAQLAQARAALAELLGGPKSPDMRAAQAALDQATINLQAQRDGLSAAKTNAQLALEQAVSRLTQAQSGYATTKHNWDYVQETGKDPVNPSVRDPVTGKSKANNVNDAQRQQYYDAYVQSEAAMHSAEAAVQQAQVAYDNARQAEVSGIEAAEAQVRSAQAALDRLLAGADRDQVAAARARVAQAEAELARLQGEQRAGSLEVAQAGITQAEANLDRITAGPGEADIAAAQAQIQQAQVALKQAELALDLATLRAPIAGTIVEFNLEVGEMLDVARPAVVLADMSNWRVETTDLTELSVVELDKDSRVTITFDAIPDLTLPGRVSQIKAIGENKQGDITYTVVIVPERLDPRLRWNMTASVVVTPK